MKLSKMLYLVIGVLLLVTSCSDEEVKPAHGNRTVLVYIAADNSLGQLGFDSADLEEMIEGMKQAPGTDYNLLVYLAGYRKPAKLIRLMKDSQGEVKQQTVMSYGLQNSVDVNVMKEVFHSVFSNYPAQSYGLVFWSHGEGWLYHRNPSTRWFGQDTSDGDYRMDIRELDEALSVAPHFDFILFDACYMQSVEVLYQLSGRADYFIGSPGEIPGPGAPYDAVTSALFSSTDPAIKIAEQYYTEYARLYNEGIGISNTNWTGGVAVSVVNSKALSALAAATRSLLALSPSLATSYPINTANILCYDPLREKHYHDLLGVMSEVQEDETAWMNFQSAYQSAVVWKGCTEKIYCTPSIGGFSARMVSMDGFEGLSTYVFTGSNQEQEAYYRQYLDWYRAAGWENVGW